MTGNRQVWLKSRPSGIPQAENFGIRDGDIPLIAEGEFLVQNHYLSSDPAARGWIADATTYWPRIEIGDTMRAFAVGEIIESRNPRYSTGEKVMGLFGWQEYAAATDKHVNLKIVPRDLPLSLHLGVLGLNGFTAYFGLLDVGLPKAGDTVVVSTAAGAVGSCVGQIAKIKGCRTVGIAGGAEKVRQCLHEFGFDAAIDYKAGIDLDEALRSVLSELESMEYGTETGASPAGETFADARVPCDRLPGPFSGSRGADFSMDQGRTHQLPRRDPRRAGACSGFFAASLSRRKHRQVCHAVARGKNPSQRVGEVGRHILECP